MAGKHDTSIKSASIFSPTVRTAPKNRKHSIHPSVSRRKNACRRLFRVIPEPGRKGQKRFPALVEKRPDKNPFLQRHFLQVATSNPP